MPSNNRGRILNSFFHPRFDPTLIPNLSGWWTARDNASMTNSGSIVAPNGGIDTWRSLIGGHSWTQGTVGNQPAYKTNVQNGLPAVEADGTDDRFISSASMAATTNNIRGLTIIMAAKVNSFHASDFRSLYSVFIPGYSALRAYCGINSSGGATAQVVAQARALDADSDSYLFTAGAYDTSFAIWTWIFDFATKTGTIRRNGVDIISTTFTNMTAGSTSATDAAEENLFSWGGGTFAPAYISELLKFARSLNPAEVTLLERQLGNLYGVAVA